MAQNDLTTHQDCKFAIEQLRAKRLLVRVDIDDALFDSCVLKHDMNDAAKSAGKHGTAPDNKSDSVIVYLLLYELKDSIHFGIRSGYRCVF